MSTNKFATFGGIVLDTKEKVIFARAIMKATLKMISPVVVHFEERARGTITSQNVPDLPFPWWDCPAQAENVDKLLHMPMVETKVPRIVTDPHDKYLEWRVYDDVLWFRFYDDDEWQRDYKLSCTITPQRIKMFAELYENPYVVELKEIDG